MPAELAAILSQRSPNLRSSVLRLPILHASVLPLQHHHLFYTVVQELPVVGRQVVVVVVGIELAAKAGIVVEAERIVVGVAGRIVAEAEQIVEEVLEAERVPDR